MKIKIFFSRLSWPALCLVMMLQRSPVVRYLAELQVSLIPRVQHIWSIVVGAVTVGAYNSVTGATGDLFLLSGFDDTTVTVGEELFLVIQVEGSLTPETWIVPTPNELPAGVDSTFNVNAGTATIRGFPTQVGSFPVTIQAWEEAGMQGDRAPDFDFTIVVEPAGPVFTQHPSSPPVDWGGNLQLSVQVQQAQGTTYQWQRILAGEAEYANIPEATDSSLVLGMMTSADQGMYRVVATNGNRSTESNAAMVTVNATRFQSWREMNFENPFSVEAGEDQNHDFDPYINLVESLFGRNPSISDTGAIPETSTELISDTLYAVFRFPGVPDGAEGQLTPQASSTLAPDSWMSLQNGVDGVIIENSAEGYFVKLPAADGLFCRLVISSAD